MPCGERPPGWRKRFTTFWTFSVALEQLTACSAYRFAAPGAYAVRVAQRVEVQRETRFLGRQGYGEFMMRRCEPAMRTVEGFSVFAISYYTVSLLSGLLVAGITLPVAALVWWFLRHLQHEDD